jgi:hypothetical protein
MLYISELGCCNNTVVSAPTGTSAYNAGFIGIIRDNNNALYLATSTIDNPPSYLRNKPTSNQINVRIHQNLSTLGTDYTPLPTRYTLILSFEQLDEDEGNIC